MKYTPRRETQGRGPSKSADSGKENHSKNSSNNNNITKNNGVVVQRPAVASRNGITPSQRAFIQIVAGLLLMSASLYGLSILQLIGKNDGNKAADSVHASVGDSILSSTDAPHGRGWPAATPTPDVPAYMQSVTPAPTESDNAGEHAVMDDDSAKSVSIAATQDEYGESARVHVTPDALAPPYRLRAVQRQPWVVGTAYVDVAKGAAEPRIFTGTVADTWRARSLWTNEFLCEHIDSVEVHMQARATFMSFHDDRPMEPLLTTLKWADFNAMVNVSSRELYVACADCPYYYYSMRLERLPRTHEWIADVQPLQPVLIDKEGLQINLWMGRKGITTATHYDASYNIFVQLQGRKRFTFFPPSAPMYLHPCLHPHYGHPQVDIKNVTKESFPRFIDSEAVVAELGPGDMLIFPPFWYHHVETLEDSVSVNVWADAPELQLADAATRLSIPLESSWDSETMAAALKILLEPVVARVLPAMNAKSFVQTHLLEQRYHPLYGAGGIQAPRREHSFKECARSSSFLASKGVELHAEAVDSYVQSMGALFDDMGGVSVREICLGNYVEYLADVLFGTDRVYSFLCDCFDQ